MYNRNYFKSSNPDDWKQINDDWFVLFYSDNSNPNGLSQKARQARMSVTSYKRALYALNRCYQNNQDVFGDNQSRLDSYAQIEDGNLLSVDRVMINGAGGISTDYYVAIFYASPSLDALYQAMEEDGYEPDNIQHILNY